MDPGHHGIGYVPPDTPIVLADSAADFSGVQGQDNWSYGTWTQNFDSDGIYAVTEFGAINSDRFFDAENNRWDLASNNSSAQITETGGHPSSANVGFFTHWVLRRWASETEGEVTISGNLGNADAAGDGTIGRIFVNGEEVYQQLVNGSQTDYSITLDLQIGDLVDFAIDPGVDSDETGDQTEFTAQIVGMPIVEIPLIPIADSGDDWSRDGIQGENGWSYGVYEPTADVDNSYSRDEFRAFSSAVWTGRRYEWPVASVDTEISSSNMYPHAEENLVHWPIRRWESNVDGNLSVEWRVSKSSSDGDGAVARVFHNGVEVDLLQLAATDRTEVTRVIEIPGVKVGDTIDLAMDPKGPAADVADADGDRLRGWMTISRQPNLADSINTDVRDAMLGVSSSAYIRIPFQVEDIGQLDVITLNMRYDDGFVAYVNGQQVVSSNCADQPAFDSTATEARPLADATQYESFDLTDRRDFFMRWRECPPNPRDQLVRR